MRHDRSGNVEDRNRTPQTRARKDVLDGGVVLFHESHADGMHARSYLSTNFQGWRDTVDFSSSIRFLFIDVEQFDLLAIDAEFHLLVLGRASIKLLRCAPQQ